MGETTREVRVDLDVKHKVGVEFMGRKVLDTPVDGGRADLFLTVNGKALVIQVGGDQFYLSTTQLVEKVYEHRDGNGQLGMIFEPALRAEKERLEKDRKGGATCRACGQYVKTYKRSLYKSMVAWLVSLAGEIQRRSGDPKFSGYVQLRDVPFQVFNGDHGRLVLWGLIKVQPNRPGYWKITPRGWRFIQDQEAIPKWLRVYNNEVIEEAPEGERVYVKTALGEDFDYEDLMNG